MSAENINMKRFEKILTALRITVRFQHDAEEVDYTKSLKEEIASHNGIKDWYEKEGKVIAKTVIDLAESL